MSPGTEHQAPEPLRVLGLIAGLSYSSFSSFAGRDCSCQKTLENGVRTAAATDGKLLTPTFGIPLGLQRCPGCPPPGRAKEVTFKERLPSSPAFLQGPLLV